MYTFHINHCNKCVFGETRLFQGDLNWEMELVSNSEAKLQELCKWKFPRVKESSTTLYQSTASRVQK